LQNMKFIDRICFRNEMNMQRENMKKLLLITDMYPDESNPVSGIFVKQQALELAKYYDIKIIATAMVDISDFVVGSDTKEDIDVQYIYSPMNKQSYFLSIFHYFRDVIPTVKSTIENWNPDIIHVHDCRHIPELFCLRSLFNSIRKPTYLTMHNNKTHPSKIRSSLTKVLYNFTLSGSYSNWTHVFTVNERLKKEISPFCDEKHITVLKNGISEIQATNTHFVETVLKRLRSDAYRLISVGNLIREKGFDLLLKAVRKLKDKNHNMQLVILGSGNEYHYLVELSHDLGLDNDVMFIPRQTNDEVRNLYPHFHCFVLPSYSETFGIVYIEAMYAGLPTIGVKGQGIDGTIIDGDNGILVEPENDDSLVEKLEFLIINPEEAKRIADNGKTLVIHEYMLDKIMKKVISEYERN